MPPSQIPLLVYTDSPDRPTGLGRICRDLAANLTSLPFFKVATYGFFGQYSSHFPWQQYIATDVDSGLLNLRHVWNDFAQGQKGILFTITPPSWIFSIVLPQFMLREKNTREYQLLSDWLLSKPFEHWAYLAIESHGPNYSYGLPTQSIIKSLDRPLFYSKWGADIAVRQELLNSAAYIPHGIFCDDWTREGQLRDRIRISFKCGPKDLLLGCVATNSTRKRLGLLFQSFAIIKDLLSDRHCTLWLHTDAPIRDWTIPALIQDLGLIDQDDVFVTSSANPRSDKWMADHYSACDVTCLPTSGEGFGYTAIESLSCGTPVVTGKFGAQAQFLEDWHPEWLTKYLALDIQGVNNLVVPIYNPMDFAQSILLAYDYTLKTSTCAEECTAHAKQWDWSVIWPRFEKWFVDGLNVQFQQPEEDKVLDIPL